MDTKDRLAAARTRLILDKPFLGALALRLPLIESDASWCRKTRSDGRSLYYNRAWIESLDLAQTQFALAREALHCALLHFYRRGTRDRFLWDEACDYAITPILLDEGFSPTPETLLMPEFEGMTAEEIYPCLDDEDDDSERDLERNSDGSDTQDDDNQDHRDMGDGGSDEDRQQRDAKDGSGDEEASWSRPPRSSPADGLRRRPALCNSG